MDGPLLNLTRDSMEASYESLDYGIKYLVDLLRARDARINELNNYICDLETQLNHESSVNENLSDLNIRLKQQLKKDASNVIDHPSSIKKLSELVQELDKRCIELTDSLIFSIELIPRSSSTSGHIDRLRTIARRPL